MFFQPVVEGCAHKDIYEISSSQVRLIAGNNPLTLFKG